MTNGPKWRVEVQLPALSRVRRWNHHRPFPSDGLVVPPTVSSASLTASGIADCCRSQAKEKPSTPLWSSAAPSKATSTVRSIDATPGLWLVLRRLGSIGACVSSGGGGGGGGGGAASSFWMVPRAEPCTIVPFVAFERRTKKVSSGSSVVSPVTSTVIVLASALSKVTVPVTGR